MRLCRRIQLLVTEEESREEKLPWLLMEQATLSRTFILDLEPQTDIVLVSIRLARE